MSYWVMAICDVEQAYAYRLMEYMNKREKNPFIIKAFTTVDELIEYGKEHLIEILLISDKAIRDNMTQVQAEHMIVLSDDKEKTNCLYEKEIYKYQSSENILNEVMCYYAEQTGYSSQLFSLKETNKIIGVYAPIGRMLKTSFAITLGQILAETQLVLYVNLEGYSGFSTLFERNYTNNLADLMYLFSQKQENLPAKLAGIVQSTEGLDYIPPVASPLDLQCVAGDEWVQFLKALHRNTKYEAVILDIGESMTSLPQLLKCCDTIYTPCGNDEVSKAKQAQYEAFLKQSGQEELLAKTIKLSFGLMRGLEYGPEHLKYSELGTYVRELLAHDGEE